MSKPTRKSLLFISLGLLVFSLFLAIVLFILDNSTYEHLDGTEIEPHGQDLIRTVIFGQLVSVPILSFIVGLVVAIFVDRDLPYSKRIVKGFLLTLTAFYGFYIVMGLIKVMTLL